jgi:hypothetical protein
VPDKDEIERTRGRAHLSVGQRKVVRAIAEALFFDGENHVPAHRLDWLVGDVDDYFSAISETTQAAIRMGLWVVQRSPMLLSGRLKTLSALTIDERLEYLHRLESTRATPLLMLFVVIKVMLAAVYFEHPEALAETGFDGMAMKGERLDRPLAPLREEDR